MKMSEPLDFMTLGEVGRDGSPLQGPSQARRRIEKNLGGAELNVAVGLSRLGHRAGRGASTTTSSGRRS